MRQLDKLLEIWYNTDKYKLSGGNMARQITVYMQDGMITALDGLANATGASRNKVITELLDSAIELFRVEIIEDATIETIREQYLAWKGEHERKD